MRALAKMIDPLGAECAAAVDYAVNFIVLAQ